MPLRISYGWYLSSFACEGSRLLARGWHSEQPKDSLGSKNALVFLVTGIEKFSREKLTKGNHYFDSVSDILNMVASDRGLLELEIEEDESAGVNDERQWNLGESDHHQPCYLRPRFPACHLDLMKFSVVDTSLAQGGAPVKVRELRSFPADSTCHCCPSRHEESNSDSFTEESSSGDKSSSSYGNSNLKVQVIIRMSGITGRTLRSREHNPECQTI